MCRDGLSLAVGVGGQKDVRRGPGHRRELVLDRGLALDQDVLRGEVVLDIDGHAAARQVADVSNARPDNVLAAQDPHERFGLGRRLHDDEGFS